MIWSQYIMVNRYMIILSTTLLGCFKCSIDQYHYKWILGTSGVSSHCYKPNVRNHQQKECDESLEISFRVIPIITVC